MEHLTPQQQLHLRGGVEAASLRVTIASDSTGLVSIDDNGSSLTVDGTVTANAGTGFVSVQTEDAATDAGNPLKLGAKADLRDTFAGTLDQTESKVGAVRGYATKRNNL